jgi:hypothetical protein
MWRYITAWGYQSTSWDISVHTQTYHPSLRFCLRIRLGGSCGSVLSLLHACHGSVPVNPPQWLAQPHFLFQVQSARWSVPQSWACSVHQWSCKSVYDVCKIGWCMCMYINRIYWHLQMYNGHDMLHVCMYGHVCKYMVVYLTTTTEIHTYICIYIHMLIYAYMIIHTYTYSYLHTYTYTHTSIYMQYMAREYIDICAYNHIHAYIQIYTYHTYTCNMCMYVYVSVCICM